MVRISKTYKLGKTNKRIKPVNYKKVKWDDG